MRPGNLMARELRNMPVSVLSTPLRGIVPRMVAPLCDDTLNVDVLERLIEHILSGGVHGLLILGFQRLEQR